jgi:hypothetical protein
MRTMESQAEVEASPLIATQWGQLPLINHLNVFGGIQNKF